METVILTLAAGTGYTVGSPNNATVTYYLVDDANVARITALLILPLQAESNGAVATG